MWPPLSRRARTTRAVDFDDQIYRALLLLLRDPEARRAAQRACRLMLVDEFQDLTPAHLLLIRLLSAPGRRGVPAQGTAQTPDSEANPDGTPGDAEEPGSQPVKTRVSWKQVLRQRKLARIMLRGDQVVTVTFAQGELTLPPCLAHVQGSTVTEEGK
ncbi:MAG: UvrD-helicase domain-containing protein [Akkermansiaceae bacterium]|nr:UvrD-helicase domain-containing protein [Akkermansiaceae bacterium]